MKLLNFIFLIRNEIINFHHISSKPIICIFRTTYGHMNDWMKVSRNGVPVTMSDNNWHNLKQVSLIRIIGDIRVPFTSNCYTYLFFLYRTLFCSSYSNYWPCRYTNVTILIIQYKEFLIVKKKHTQKCDVSRQFYTV